MKQYLDLMKEILVNGDIKDPARENMPRTRELFVLDLEFDMNDGFPLLTTKKMYTKGIISELIFFLKGKVTLEYLHENNCHIWDDDVKRWDKESATILGKSYPYFWRSFGAKKIIGYPDKKPFTIKLNDIPENMNLEIYHSKNYGDFVRSNLCYLENRHKIFEIYFLNTGYKTAIREEHIKDRSIYDPYFPKYLNVACTGIYNKKDILTIKFKKIWEHMIDRCYNENNIGYKNYGGRGVRVSNRWKCFEYFLEDIKDIPNYELKIKQWKLYELDKDINGNGLLYSKTTCKFATKMENISTQHKKYIIKNKDGFEYLIDNVPLFVKKNNLNEDSFYSLLSGNDKSYKGFTLVRKNIDNGIDQIKNLINLILSNPNSRYQQVLSWDPMVLENNEVCLPPCHILFSTNIRKGEFLDLLMVQRSVDWALGLPFNIASYAFLLHILAKITGYKPGKFKWHGNSCHLYENQIEGCLEQLQREPRKLPWLDWNYGDKNTNKFLEIVENKLKDKKIYESEELTELFTLLSSKSFLINDYNPYPTIKFPLSTGLNKPEITTTFEELKLN